MVPAVLVVRQAVEPAALADQPMVVLAPFWRVRLVWWPSAS